MTRVDGDLLPISAYYSKINFDYHFQREKL